MHASTLVPVNVQDKIGLEVWQCGSSRLDAVIRSGSQMSLGHENDFNSAPCLYLEVPKFIRPVEGNPVHDTLFPTRVHVFTAVSPR